MNRKSANRGKEIDTPAIPTVHMLLFENLKTKVFMGKCPPIYSFAKITPLCSSTREIALLNLKGGLF